MKREWRHWKWLHSLIFNRRIEVRSKSIPIHYMLSSSVKTEPTVTYSDHSLRKTSVRRGLGIDMLEYAI